MQLNKQESIEFIKIMKNTEKREINDIEKSIVEAIIGVCKCGYKFRQKDAHQTPYLVCPNCGYTLT